MGVGKGGVWASKVAATHPQRSWSEASPQNISAGGLPAPNASSNVLKCSFPTPKMKLFLQPTPGVIFQIHRTRFPAICPKICEKSTPSGGRHKIPIPPGPQGCQSGSKQLFVAQVSAFWVGYFAIFLLPTGATEIPDPMK